MRTPLQAVQTYQRLGFDRAYAQREIFHAANLAAEHVGASEHDLAQLLASWQRLLDQVYAPRPRLRRRPRLPSHRP
jgi:hypothetical protein